MSTIDCGGRLEAYSVCPNEHQNVPPKDYHTRCPACLDRKPRQRSLSLRRKGVKVFVKAEDCEPYETQSRRIQRELAIPVLPQIQEETEEELELISFTDDVYADLIWTVNALDLSPIPWEKTPRSASLPIKTQRSSLRLSRTEDSCYPLQNLIEVGRIAQALRPVFVQRKPLPKRVKRSRATIAFDRGVYRLWEMM